MIKVIAHVRRRIWLHDLVVFVLPLATTGFHGAALVVWLGYANAGFYIDCEDWDIRFTFSDAGPVCVTEGPRISLAGFIFLWFAA